MSTAEEKQPTMSMHGKTDERTGLSGGHTKQGDGSDFGLGSRADHWPVDWTSCCFFLAFVSGSQFDTLWFLDLRVCVCVCRNLEG